MEMDYERAIGLTNSEALDIVAQFLTKEWRHLKPEDISISRCQTGVNNEVYFLTRKTKGIEEPDRLVIRKYATIEGSQDEGEDRPKELKRIGSQMRATIVEQVIIMMELADQGLGPHILGVYESGRIEEFIDCHKVSFEECRDPILESDIAINLGRIHAIKVPMRKPNYDFVNILKLLHQELVNNIPFYEGFGNDELLNVVKYDFGSDLDRLEPLFSFEHNRMVFMNWDPHLDNICVRNNPEEGQLKTVIFDYEIAGYNIRGKDLGLFIVSRCGFFPISRDDRRLESKEEAKRFLESYQSEYGKQFQDFDPEGKDSIDHLWIESLLGGVASCLCFLFFISNMTAAKKGEGPVVQSLSKFIPSLFHGFTECLKLLDKEDTERILK